MVVSAIITIIIRCIKNSSGFQSECISLAEEETMASFRPERRAPGDYGDMKGITQDEISKLQKAMKQKQFRDHIDEYTREVSDPAHRQEYLDYLAQIEAKGEMPEGQQLLRCQPGLCAPKFSVDTPAPRPQMMAVEMQALTPEERERRRQLAAEKAQERQDVSMARGIGNTSKVKSLQERGEKDILLGRLEEQLCSQLEELYAKSGEELPMHVRMLSLQQLRAHLEETQQRTAGKNPTPATIIGKVKTSIGFKTGQKQKCFINIVHTDRLDDMQLIKAESGEGQQVHLPYSLSPPRPDRDQKDEYCMTCDFAVSTGTFQRAAQNSQILKLLIDTAADGLSQQFLKGHEEVSKDYKVMQRLACKGGQPMPMSVRAELLKKGAKSQAPKTVPNKDAITPAELKEMRQEAKRKTMSGVPQEDKEEVQMARERERETETSKVEKGKEVVPGRIRVPQHRRLGWIILVSLPTLNPLHRHSGVVWARSNATLKI
eukprot:s910_g14.t2